ncbi:MAG TPA: hypothetical protein ENI14_03150 [Thermoplasmatales archaeon]|nr:hypothetical protein [Thermoplasmatales archaeon]
MKGIEKKGMISPFTILTSILTGGFFPLLGSFFAYIFINRIYWEGIILTSVGGFVAHYFLAHSIHDLYHYKIEKRSTLSKKSLKIVFAISAIFLLFIAIYLTLKCGWPVLIFSIIGAIACIYAEGLLHHESQMAFGAMFLVIGSFYVQVGYPYGIDGAMNIGFKPWLEIILMSLFAFFSQYGWLMFYRIDDHGWKRTTINKSIMLTKTGLVFLVLVFVVHALL